MRRAQLSVEFIILVSMAFLIGAVFLGSAADLFQRMGEYQRIAALNDIGYQVQDELIVAATVSDGYQRTFTVPNTADRFTYTLTTTETSLTLSSGSTIITYQLPEHTGNVVKGPNNVRKDGDGVHLA